MKRKVNKEQGKHKRRRKERIKVLGYEGDNGSRKKLEKKQRKIIQNRSKAMREERFELDR